MEIAVETRFPGKLLISEFRGSEVAVRTEDEATRREIPTSGSATEDGRVAVVWSSGSCTLHRISENGLTDIRCITDAALAVSWSGAGTKLAVLRQTSLGISICIYDDRGARLDTAVAPLATPPRQYSGAARYCLSWSSDDAVIAASTSSAISEWYVADSVFWQVAERRLEPAYGLSDVYFLSNNKYSRESEFQSSSEHSAAGLDGR